MSKTIAIACLQQGSARSVNEDNFYLAGSFAVSGEKTPAKKTYTGTSGLQFFAVADGMGGEALGDESARLAMHILDQQISKNLATGKQFDFYSFAQKYIIDANNAICAHLRNYRGIAAGTTISLLVIDNDTACTMSLGNSRIYLYRNKELHLLTQDHLGPLPEKKILSRYLGNSENLQLTEEDNLTRTVLEKGDILLLATDGLTSVLGKDQLAALMAKPAAFVQQVDNMRRLVIEQQGEDDMSLVAIKVIDPVYTSGAVEYAAGGGYMAKRILSWLKPVLFFLFFGLLGFLTGKLIFSLPGWLRQLSG